jgi:hypothetical protein
MKTPGVVDRNHKKNIFVPRNKKKCFFGAAAELLLGLSWGIINIPPPNDTIGPAMGDHLLCVSRGPFITILRPGACFEGLSVARESVSLSDPADGCKKKQTRRERQTNL